MKCPKCRNKGFVPSEGIKYPIRNLGKDKYETCDFRWYICLQCGYKWKTKEEFYQEVQIKSAAGVDSGD